MRSQGDVAIDASDMLQDANSDVVTAAGDTVVVHMDRDSLHDIPAGCHQVAIIQR